MRLCVRGGYYLVSGERKPKDPIIRPSCFKIVKLINYSINQSQPPDFTLNAHSLDSNP